MRVRALLASLSTAAERVGSKPKIVQFPALRDNYGFLIHDPATGATAAIDAPEVAPIVSALNANGWTLTHILNTHHHADHCGGNPGLRALYTDVEVVAPSVEADQIRGGVDVSVGEADVVNIGTLSLETLDVGGHTRGHVAYYCAEARAAFVGDAIFALGCGRMSEGTYPQFWKSLQTIANLPDDTSLYCAHEYTLLDEAANARFAVTIEPNSSELARRVEAIDRLRAEGKPTVPTTVALEKATNPFLRPAAVRDALGLAPDLADVDVFAEVRKRKDAF